MPEAESPPGAIETELDRLFQAKASAFVSERNQLVQTLRRAGNREAAEAVARLARPTPVAWAINQVHFRAREELDELLDAGAALREAQETQGATDVFAERKREHQTALRQATERALAFAEEAGVGTNANFKRRVEMTLSLLSAAAERVEPSPGRMIAELEPVGFDALAGMDLAPAPPKAPKRAAEVDAARGPRLAAVKGALEAASAELRRLEREAEYRESLHDRAARDAADAEERAATARRGREEARQKADEARARVEEARRALATAEQELRELAPSHE
jgi:hypothetical protein